jgi:endogenous inhibitor of DNA gyrase (YacG/DUF329 family)
MTSCAHCGQPITITSRNPNRRFCSPRCRVADWHARHPRHPSTGLNVVDHTIDAVVDAVPSVNGIPAANGVQHCPHCRQPVAVINVLVPAAAAHIPTPEVIHMNPS